MWIAEKITGNRKTYSLCVIGGVRWDIGPERKAELKGVLDRMEREWIEVVRAVQKDRNVQRRARGIGVADRRLVKDAGLVGPMARASGVAIDCRRDHPYAAYGKVEFDVIVHDGCDVWSRLIVRALEVFESIKIIRHCLEMMPEGPLAIPIDDEIPAGASASPRWRRREANRTTSS